MHQRDREELSQQMCVAHGGRVQPRDQTVHVRAATAVSGQKVCEDLGGVYLPQEHGCQLDK
jgi:hypothetical protein